VDVHHVVKRSAAPALRYDPANALLLCRDCHHFTEHHPQDAVILGLLGRSWHSQRAE
jgi:5-methylcytosine-specific restriction endonuclease McrA